MSARAGGRPQRKTFGDYMSLVDKNSPVSWARRGAPGANNELLDRLTRRSPADRMLQNGRQVTVADEIDNLPKLQTWARLRWPDWYTRRAVKGDDCSTGKHCMANLWAQFLAWAEADES